MDGTYPGASAEGWRFFMDIPGEGKAFLTVTDLMEMGYGSRNTILQDIEDGIIPGMRIVRPGKKRARVVIPRDEFIEAVERTRAVAAPSGDGAAEGGDE